MKYLLLLVLLVPSLSADDIADLKKKAFDLLFNERFVKRGGEITAARIPFKMKVKQVYSSCTTLQRVLSGVMMCPVGVEGTVIQWAPRSDWKVTVWAESGVSRYGEEFNYSDIKHMLDFRPETVELTDKKLAITDRKFYHSTGTDSKEINKRIYKNRKIHERNPIPELIVHGVFWANVKPEYVKYERDSDYKGVDLVYARDERKEAGTPVECFKTSEGRQSRKFEELYK